MKKPIDWWRVGVIALIVGLVSFEIAYDIRYFKPQSMPEYFTLVFVLTVIARLLLYCVIILVYNKIMGYLYRPQMKTEEWRIELIRLYHRQYSESTSAYERLVLQRARQYLNSGCHPKDVENWVVQMDKIWRKKL